MSNFIYYQSFLTLFVIFNISCRNESKDSSQSSNAKVASANLNENSTTTVTQSKNGVTTVYITNTNPCPTPDSSTASASTASVSTAPVSTAPNTSLAPSAVTSVSTLVSASTSTSSTVASSTAPAPSTASGSVTVKLNVDNGYYYYISTDDTVNGTQIDYGNPNGPYEWGTTASYTTALTPGVKNYVHIIAMNTGGPAGFLGSFTLSGSGFTFENNQQSLSSNVSSGLHANMTAFGASDLTLSDLGVNSVGPWGTMDGQPTDAHWIWAGPITENATIYISIPIIPH